MRRNSFQMAAKSPSSLAGVDENENESESNQNSAKFKSPAKNFMSPTISTASKSLSLKKKILAEWTETSPDANLKKPSNLGPKSISPNVGTSNSNPIPNSSSKLDDVNVEDETFVPDSSTKPYDPLTNYLSPRPKFLRYNPNRRRKAIFPRQSLSHDSRDSSVYSTEESSVNSELLGGTNGHSENQEQVEVENEEEEEETVVGDRKFGLKWVFFKSLTVLAILVLCTMYTSSMNLPELPLDVEYQELGNNTFIRGVEFTSWVFDVREESMMGQIVVAIQDQKTEEVAEKIVFLEDLVSDSMSNEEFWTDNDEPNEVESQDVQLENQVQIISEDLHKMVSENEVEILSESESESESESNRQLWVNPKNVVWGVIPSLVTWGAALVVKFYLKCKKASSKTSSSSVKLSIEVEKSGSRLPPKAVERIIELNPTSGGGVHLREEKLEKGSSRVIPKVQMLGEFVVGGEFRRRSFDLQNEQRIHSRRTFSTAKFSMLDRMGK